MRRGVMRGSWSRCRYRSRSKSNESAVVALRGRDGATVLGGGLCPPPRPSVASLDTTPVCSLDSGYLNVRFGVGCVSPYLCVATRRGVGCAKARNKNVSRPMIETSNCF